MAEYQIRFSLGGLKFDSPWIDIDTALKVSGDLMCCPNGLIEEIYKDRDKRENISATQLYSDHRQKNLGRASP